MEESIYFQANDLMLGDWIKIGKVPLRVIQLTHFAHKDDSVVLETGSEYLDVEPIPLTVEILEKNGWKWNTFYTMIELVVGTIHIGWGFYKDCISVSDHSDEGHCQISSLRCEYVHELQHALRLCGIDKEIVL